jgi:hypothetical protein
LHRPAGAFRRLSGPNNAGEKDAQPCGREQERPFSNFSTVSWRPRRKRLTNPRLIPFLSKTEAKA